MCAYHLKNYFYYVLKNKISIDFNIYHLILCNYYTHLSFNQYEILIKLKTRK